MTRNAHVAGLHGEDARDLFGVSLFDEGEHEHRAGSRFELFDARHQHPQVGAMLRNESSEELVEFFAFGRARAALDLAGAKDRVPADAQDEAVGLRRIFDPACSRSYQQTTKSCGRSSNAKPRPLRRFWMATTK